MDKLIDLHIHSIYSDGENNPTEIIKKAKQNNIGTISITDHDTICAYEDINLDKDVEVIPGIELSADDKKGRMHILGLGINPDNKELKNITKELRENSINNFLLIVDYIKTKGVIVSNKDISLLINKVGDVGRPHLAKLLIDYGYVETVQEAFDKYLIEAYEYTKNNRKRLTYDECFELIKCSGGIPVLAHPISLNRSDKELEELIIKMISCGLIGIEVYHSHHELEQLKFYKYLVEKYNLLYSVGSDYHGEVVKPDIKIGEGKEKNLCLTNCSVLNYLKTK